MCRHLIQAPPTPQLSPPSAAFPDSWQQETGRAQASATEARRVSKKNRKPQLFIPSFVAADSVFHLRWCAAAGADALDRWPLLPPSGSGVEVRRPVTWLPVERPPAAQLAAAASDGENRDLVEEAGEICCFSFICSSVEKLACDHWLWERSPTEGTLLITVAPHQVVSLCSWMIRAGRRKAGRGCRNISAFNLVHLRSSGP